MKYIIRRVKDIAAVLSDPIPEAEIDPIVNEHVMREIQKGETGGKIYGEDYPRKEFQGIFGLVGKYWWTAIKDGE